MDEDFDLALNLHVLKCPQASGAPLLPTAQLTRCSRTFRITALALAISLGTSSCATVDNFAKNNSANINCMAGGAAGAAAGVALAILTKQNDKAIIGSAVVGAAAGCGIALMYKDRLNKLEQLAREENLKMQLETLQTSGSTPSAAPEDAGIVAQIEDQGMFPVGSATLSSDGQRQVRRLASAFVTQPDQPQTSAILVVGHTDATGSAQGNQQLSERRARAVASILAEQGIARERMYFQGAGASRPIADNSDSLQRGKNRRVEIVEVNDRDTLVKRVNAEQNNPKYLAHGTSTEVATPVPTKASTSSGPTPAPSTGKAVTNSTSNTRTPSITAARPHKGKVIDFGGQPAIVSSWTLGQAITPKSGGFALIAKAHASDIPMSSCESDKPRQSGEVFNLASGQVLQTRATTDYLPGYNNRVWAQTVNGHLVTISPVSILRDAAAVDRHPFVEVVQNYETGNRKAQVKAQAIANTYEGEDRVLYRVFVTNPQEPVSCLDVVFSKGNSQATDGMLFYPKSSGEAYSARFIPVRT
jgi:outer membrane protein OmpA-like peptidoglycan-associated protein